MGKIAGELVPLSKDEAIERLGALGDQARHVYRLASRYLIVEGEGDCLASLPDFPRYLAERRINAATDRLATDLADFVKRGGLQVIAIDPVIGVRWLMDLLHTLRLRWGWEFPGELDDTDDWDVGEVIIWPNELRALREAGRLVRLSRASRSGLRIHRAGGERSPLSQSQAEVVLTLWRAADHYMIGRVLKTVSKHSNAVNLLKEVHELPGWKDAIVLPGQGRRGYRINHARGRGLVEELLRVVAPEAQQTSTTESHRIPENSG